jgi:hypothetical protein
MSGEGAENAARRRGVNFHRQIEVNDFSQGEQDRVAATSNAVASVVAADRDDGRSDVARRRRVSRNFAARRAATERRRPLRRLDEQSDRQRDADRHHADA